ncbi:MAG: hypothetical protein K0S33_1430 [Bacteroidetes bacterium]|jgi:hypothetical protein|nr:hypothetical protein [Bacteroidota bacterium]
MYTFSLPPKCHVECSGTQECIETITEGLSRNVLDTFFVLNAHKNHSN